MKAKVTLFKPSGKYYSEEEWEVPTEVPDHSEHRGYFMRKVLGPYDMQHSPDFRRIDGGPVLVETQEPWGYPFLLLKNYVRDYDKEAEALRGKCS